MDKRPAKSLRIWAAVGLVICSGSLVLQTRFHNIPDFWRGIMTGAGIGILVAVIIKSRRLRMQQASKD